MMVPVPFVLWTLGSAAFMLCLFLAMKALAGEGAGRWNCLWCWRSPCLSACLLGCAAECTVPAECLAAECIQLCR